MTYEQLKEALFEVYSAGYVDGFNGNRDIRTAFEEWFAAINKGER